MTAIFTGMGAGLERGSANILGGAGQIASPNPGLPGRGGESVSVNAATGNLVIARQDEFLTGPGPDASVSRTYNSLGDTGDRDNGDGWQLSTTRRIFGVTGTLNASGSTVRRLGGDGSVITYAWGSRGGQSAYWSTDGAGSYDSIQKTATGWLWTDGDSKTSESYEVSVAGAGEWRLAETRDIDGQRLSYSYHSGSDRLYRVTTHNGEWLQYSWSGNNLAAITTGLNGSTETVTRYSYDGSNRLTRVTVDLSPEDNSISDGKVYETVYTYEGSSTRIASISQTDGSRVDIAYDSTGRVASISQAVISGTARTTSLAYHAGFTAITAPDGSVTRLDYQSASLAPQSIFEWNYLPNHVLAENAGAIAGEPATKFTSAPGAVWSGINSQLTSVVSGDTVTFTIDLMAVAGSATSQTLGILGTASGWGTGGSSARIVSGPGSVSPIVGGLFAVSDLSSSEATRVEITRTFSQTDSVVSYLYVDALGGYRDGQQLIAAGASVTKNTSIEDSYKQLTKITAPPAVPGGAQQVTQFAYNANGDLASVTDAAGNTTTYAYNDRGSVAKITSPGGSVTQRWYDGNDRLIRERTYGGHTPTASESQWSHYTYDAEGHLTFAIDPEGRVREYTYLASGLRHRVIDYPENFYPDGNTTPSHSQMENWRNGISDRSNSVATINEYDARGNLVDSRSHAISTVTGGEDWSDIDVRSYATYDHRGRLISRRRENETAETFVYDGLGRMIGSVDTAGGTTSLVFDDANSRTVITTAGGHVTTKTYNKAGELVSETGSGAFDVTGTAGYQYDDMGRLRVHTDERGAKTRYVYDGAGRLVGEVSPSGYLTEYRYDVNDRLVATARYTLSFDGSHLAALDDPNNRLTIDQLRPADHAYDIWTWTIYDSHGRVAQRIDGTGGLVDFEYDRSDRLIKTTRRFWSIPGATVDSYKTAPPTSPFVISSHGQDAITRTFYDRAGLQIGTLDGEGYLTESIYDSAGRKVEDIAYATKTSSTYWADGTFAQLKGSVDPGHSDDRRMHYVYDGNGLLRYQLDGLGQVTANSYDATGRLTGTSRYATSIATTDYTFDNVKALVAGLGNVTLDRHSWNVYNPAGQIVFTIGGLGEVTEYSYAPTGQVSKTVSYDRKLGRTSGQPSLATMQNWTAGGRSNAANRIVRNYYTASGLLRFAIDGEGYATRYDYDAEGRKTARLRWDNPIGVTDNTTIAQAASLVGGSYVGNKYSYNSEDQLATVIDGEGKSESYEYFRNGFQHSVWRGLQDSGNSRETLFTYDGLNRLVESRVLGVDSYVSDGVALNKYSSTTLLTRYEYDANGNVVKTVDPEGRETFAYYDRLGRKTAQVDGERYLTAWTYDAEGNVTRERSYANRAATPALGTPPAVTADNTNDRITEYTYDRVGNRLTEKRLNVLVHNGSGSSTLLGSVTVGHTYNGLGQVVARTEATGDRTTYAYDNGGRLIMERKAGFADHLGTPVTPSTSYFYNGLGNLARTRQHGATGTSERVTRYEYSGDKLRMVWDAENHTTFYIYDQAGRLIHEYWERKDSAGAPIKQADGSNAAYEGVRYDFDKAGRLVRQYAVTYHGNTSWQDAGPRTTMAYNAYGDIVSVKVGTGAAQTENRYDAAGRLWASNAGDGVWRFFGYDRAGNQTAVIESAGYAFSGSTTFEQARSLIGRVDVNATFTQYDKRNLATRVTEEQRQLSVSSTRSLVTSRTYNAFGEVASETDAAGALLSYTYNTLGGMIRSEGPTVKMTREDGTSLWIKPSEDFYYDESGRLVAQRDANGTYAAGGTSTNSASKQAHTGNLTRIELLAGTGYGGSQALVKSTIAADGGVVTTGFDLHGNARKITDEVGRITTQTFDRLDRLTQASHANGLIDYFSYDSRGQRVARWNNVYGSGDKETTDYDSQGRVIASRAFGGDVTTVKYTWSNTIGGVGGWAETVSVDADRLSASDQILAATSTSDI